jgi:hypothetical protein
VVGGEKNAFIFKIKINSAAERKVCVPLCNNTLVQTGNASVFIKSNELYVFCYHFTIDWGDGNRSNIIQNVCDDIYHEYKETGEYTIEINGLFEGFNVNSNKSDYVHIKSLITKIIDWGNTELQAMYYMFQDSRRLTELPPGNLPVPLLKHDTNITGAKYADYTYYQTFQGCTSLSQESLDKVTFNLDKMKKFSYIVTDRNVSRY